MLHITQAYHQLNIHATLSQDSGDHASTTAQQGSDGTQTPPQGQLQGHYPRRDDLDEKKEDRMKQDLLGIGSQFETKWDKLENRRG